MIRLLSILALSLPLMLGISVQVATAQTLSPTPRQTFTAFATNTPLSELKFKPFNMPVSAPKPAMDIAAEVKSIPETLIKSAPDLQKKTPEDLTEGLKAKPNSRQTAAIEAVPDTLKTPLKNSTEDTPKSDAKAHKIITPTPPAQTPHAGLPLQEILPEDKAEQSESLPPENTPLLPPKDAKAEKTASLPPDVKTRPILPILRAPKTKPRPQGLAGAPPNSDSKDYSNLLPFYTNAEEYLKSRGTAPHTYVKLVYKVSLANAQSNLTAAVENTNNYLRARLRRRRT